MRGKRGIGMASSWGKKDIQTRKGKASRWALSGKQVVHVLDTFEAFHL